MSTPSPSPSPPPPSSSANPTVTTPVSIKKSQPAPWTHQETVLLIQTYQEKWYSLKRGQLKANQWEDVANTVAARCGYDYQHPSKTALQCRHKMEKLRRRYRDEKRIISLGGSSAWPYFDLMHSLEHGTQPISTRPLAEVMPRNTAAEEDEEENELDGEEEEEEEEDSEDHGYRRSRSRSINYIIRKPGAVTRFSGRDESGILRGKRKREEELEAATAAAEEEEEEKEGRELARAIRAFADRIMRIERRKMEMVRETEKWRVEMEKKRMNMILDSQRKIVEMISSAVEGAGSRAVDEF